jgi:oligosaccharide repeat unit polymerase
MNMPKGVIAARRPALSAKKRLLSLLVTDTDARAVASDYRRNPRWTFHLTAIASTALATQSIWLCLDQTIFELKLNLILQTVALVTFGLWSSKAGGSFLNAPALFLASIYIWHSTFLLGHYFELAPIFEFTGMAFTYGDEFVYKATGLVGLCMSLSVFGVFVGYWRQGRLHAHQTRRTRLKRQCYSLLGPRATRVARGLLATMLLVLLAYLVTDGSQVFHAEYLDLYTDPSTSTLSLLFYRTQFLWVFVTIFMVASHCMQSRALRIALLLLLALSVVLAMLGSRSMPFICLSAIVVSVDCFVRRLRLVMLFAFLLTLSAVSYVIDSARGAGLGLNVFNFSATDRDSIDLLHFFYQNGMIIRDVMRTMEFSRMDGPVYGQSFLAAAVSVVPKPLLDRVGYREPTPPSMWLVENSPDVPVGHGIGYSLVAEVYYNFGMPGCLLFALFGFAISTGYFRYIFSGDMFAIVLTLNVSVMLMLHMRNDVASYLRLVVYVAVLLAYLKWHRRRTFELSRRFAGAIG